MRRYKDPPDANLCPQDCYPSLASHPHPMHFVFQLPFIFPSRKSTWIIQSHLHKCQVHSLWPRCTQRELAVSRAGSSHSSSRCSDSLQNKEQPIHSINPSTGISNVINCYFSSSSNWASSSRHFWEGKVYLEGVRDKCSDCWKGTWHSNLKWYFLFILTSVADANNLFKFFMHSVLVSKSGFFSLVHLISFSNVILVVLSNLNSQSKLRCNSPSTHSI